MAAQHLPRNLVRPSSGQKNSLKRKRKKNKVAKLAKWKHHNGIFYGISRSRRIPFAFLSTAWPKNTLCKNTLCIFIHCLAEEYPLQEYPLHHNGISRSRRIPFAFLVSHSCLSAAQIAKISHLALSCLTQQTPCFECPL